MTEYCTDTNDDCLSISMYECRLKISTETCHQITNETQTTDIWTHGLNTKMMIAIWHNFTHLQNSSIFFVHTQREPSASTLVYQTEIKFLQINESLFYNHPTISGNIGYILGKPLIISTTTLTNESETIFTYFNDKDESDWHTIRLPKIRQNLCVLSKGDQSTYETINFGENLFMKCDGMLTEKNGLVLPLTIESNFTAICQQFQEEIFHYLMNDIRQKENETHWENIVTFLSTHGNPQNKSDDWIRIELTEKSLNMIGGREQNVVGIFDKDISEGEFLCTNMILNVRYEFLYGRLTVNGVRNQQIVKRAFIEFGNRVDLRFKFDEEIRVPIYIDVMFLDLTSNGKRIIPQLFVFVIASFIVKSIYN